MPPLWQRIAGHEFPAGFAARVASENGWSTDAAAEAIGEYRRFVFLACLSREEATPSKAVDAVWHTHLLFTRDYWERFCPDVLQRPLHHAPGDGSRDAARHAAQYERTLGDYARWFGPAPARWWPSQRAARPVRTGLAVSALVAMPAMAWAAARPSNPLDWSGPDFLALYAVSLGLVIVGSLLLRAWLRRAAAPAVRGAAPGTLELAYLAGGAARTVDAAAAELHRRGALQWDAHANRFEARATRDRLEPAWERMARAICASLDDAAREADRLRPGMEERGLWLPAAAARRIGHWSALPALLLLGLGVAKVAIGVQRDRPVAVLVVLCVITAVFALAMLASRGGPTRAGREAVAARRRELGATRGARDRELGLAVALGGTALLSGTALAGYHDLRRPTDTGGNDTSSSTTDSASDSGSSDSGGSGCGGCGGGGD